MRIILLLFLILVAAAIARRGRSKNGFRSKPSSSQNRIVGGTPVDIADYGWQVSLQYSGGQHFCGGSILNENWILTAGHCFTSNNPLRYMKIRAGSNLTATGGEVKSVKDVIIHPDYNKTTLDNDAALVRLSSGLKLNGGTVRAAKLVGLQQEIPVGSEVTVTGWGALKQGGKASPTLEGVTVPIVSKAECEKQLGQLGETMFCAGAVEGGKDSCQGDSGGPLVTQDKTLIGIVSWGIGCAQPNTSGVYAEIASPIIRNFITKYVKLDDQQ